MYDTAYDREDLPDQMDKEDSAYCKARDTMVEGGADPGDTHEIELATTVAWCSAHGLAETAGFRQFEHIKEACGGEVPFLRAIFAHMGLFHPGGADSGVRVPTRFRHPLRALADRLPALGPRLFSPSSPSTPRAQAGGRFILRIEDIDATRRRPDYEAAIYEDLAWLQLLTWNSLSGFQSEHMADYSAALRDLSERGLTYRCFCTRREVAEAIENAPRHGAMEAFRGATLSRPMKRPPALQPARPMLGGFRSRPPSEHWAASARSPSKSMARARTARTGRSRPVRSWAATWSWPARMSASPITWR